MTAGLVAWVVTAPALAAFIGATIRLRELHGH